MFINIHCIYIYSVSQKARTNTLDINFRPIKYFTIVYIPVVVNIPGQCWCVMSTALRNVSLLTQFQHLL